MVSDCKAQSRDGSINADTRVLSIFKATYKDTV